MSNLKLLAEILRLKDLKITGFQFQQRDTELHLGVKPYKKVAAVRSANAAAGLGVRARRPDARRILLSLAARSFCGMPRERLSAPRMGGRKKRSRGRRRMPWSPIA